MITHLYIKLHTKTGLKYFGKTNQDPYQYNGSGKKWTSHVNYHGKEYIKTLKVWSFEDLNECSSFAIKFSVDNNIVYSTSWANLKIEDGLSGGDMGPVGRAKNSMRYKGRTLPEDHKLKIKHSINAIIDANGALKPAGWHHTEEAKLKITNSLIGREVTNETRSKISKANSNPSLETLAKMSKASKGRIPSPETRLKMSESAKRRRLMRQQS